MVTLWRHNVNTALKYQNSPLSFSNGFCSVGGSTDKLLKKNAPIISCRETLFLTHIHRFSCALQLIIQPLIFFFYYLASRLNDFTWYSWNKLWMNSGQWPYTFRLCSMKLKLPKWSLWVQFYWSRSWLPINHASCKVITILDILSSWLLRTNFAFGTWIFACNLQ